MPHPEELGLDGDRLARLVDAYAGYADALAERPEVGPWAASSRMLAASYALLVDPAHARDLFARAARDYAAQEAPLAVVLAVCAGDTGLVLELAVPLADKGLSAGPLQRLAVALGQAWLAEAGGPRVELDARGEGSLERFTFPAGRLGVPPLAYLLAIDEVQVAAEELWNERRESVWRVRHRDWRAGLAEPRRALPRLAAMLERAAEPVRGAMADRFHWQRAHCAVLPAEPEAVAACRCVLRAWTQRGRTVGELFAHVAADQVDRVAVVPLELAADLDEGHEHGDEPDGSPRGPGPGREDSLAEDLMKRMFEPDYGLGL